MTKKEKKKRIGELLTELVNSNTEAAMSTSKHRIMGEVKSSGFESDPLGAIAKSHEAVEGMIDDYIKNKVSGIDTKFDMGFALASINALVDIAYLGKE